MTDILPFDDSFSKKSDFRLATAISGNNLGNIENYRQGVEIRNDSDLYLGAVKIHAGYPNHELPQNEFGQPKSDVTKETWFLEIDAFDVVSFISSKNNSSTANVVTTYNGTVPTTISNQSVIMDGILEPLIIRPHSVFYVGEGLFRSHRILATLLDGNEEKEGSADQIVTVYELNDRQNVATYLDSADTIGTIAINKDTASRLNSIIPYFDMQTSSGSIVSNNMDNQFHSVVGELGSRQDDYVQNNKKSMTSGFTYDTAQGTDSIAFGGFYYISCSMSSPPQEPILLLG